MIRRLRAWRWTWSAVVRERLAAGLGRPRGCPRARWWRVRLYRIDALGLHEPLVEMTHDEWASLVAHVSANVVDGQVYARARAFHMGLNDVEDTDTDTDTDTDADTTRTPDPDPETVQCGRWEVARG